MPNVTSPTLYMVVLIVGILSFSYNEPSECRLWHAVQFAALFAITLSWGYVTAKMGASTPQQKQQEQENLQKAITMAGNSGVTQEWYNQIGDVLSKVTIAIASWLVSMVLHSIIFAYPNSVWEHLANAIQSEWENNILQNYSHKTIFVFGVFASDFFTFWGFGLGYAFLDLTRPSLLLPFKVQENWVLTKEDFLRAAKKAMVNQFLVLGVAYLLWDVYPFLAPEGFSVQLPSLFEALIQMLAFLPLMDIWFYSWHVLMHKSDFLWSHIHYIHHEWTAPIAITAVYAHPIEHIWVNIITVMIGPFIFGSHVVIWWLWTALSVQDTVQTHSGWHLPFLGVPDRHDFHHSTGWSNFGVIGVMDNFFGTDSAFFAAWQSMISHRYGNQDYPVDKILASNGQEQLGIKKEKVENECKTEEAVDMDWETLS